MDWLHENALLTTSCLWRSSDGEPWIVTFDFAEVAGRLECVGMRLRSFIEVEESDEFGAYRASLPGTVSRDDLLRPLDLPQMSMLDPESVDAYLKALDEAVAPPKHAAWQDSDAAGAILGDRERCWAPQKAPRPLRTGTLRELPLGVLLAKVRDDVASAWRSGLLAPRTAAHPVEVELPAELQAPGEPLEDREQLSPRREELEQRTWELLQTVKRSGGWDDALIKERDELELRFAELEQLEGPRPELRRAPGPTRPAVQIDANEFRRLTQQAVGSFSSPGHKAGRPPKYSPAELEIVARTYREAYAGGSTSPTKDVAEKLGLERWQAGKLVMRCRQAGLLAPTQLRRAGGANPPQDRDEGPES